MRAKAQSWAMAGLLGLLMVPARAGAQSPTPADLIGKFRPIQKDLAVDYDIPTEQAAIDACKVEGAKNAEGKVNGYALRDGQGRILRKFVDTNGKKTNGQTRLDQWSYYKDGFEVYREVDLDENGALDECRWLNAGGTKIAQVQGNRIVGWKRISAEEASKVLVQALVSGNAALIETVLATPEELKAAGAPASVVESAGKVKASLAADLEVLRKGLAGWDAQTAWSRFDGMLPHVIPADVGLADDLILYENAFIFAAPPGNQGDPLALAYLQAPEIIRVGETWKFVGLPQAIDPKKPVAAAVQGGIRAALFQVDGGGGGTDGEVGNPEHQKALTALADHDKNAPDPSGSKQEIAKFHVDRVNLLRPVIQTSSGAENQLNFTKQAIDSLAAALQTGLYPAAGAALEKYAAQADAAGSYAAYRKLLAEYQLDTEQPGNDFIKAQKAMMEKLEAFIAKYPKSAEAPEVLLQLAITNEFNAEEERAKGFYTKLVGDYPQSEPAKKAAGALKRIDLVGKTLELSGAGTGGKAVSTDEYRGKTLVVAFWTSGSDQARREQPELAKLYQKFQPKGFAIVGVNLDNDRATLDAFLKDSPLPWAQIHEEGGMDSRLADEFGIISLPTMILVDPQGKVLNRNIRTAAELERYLDKILNTTAAANLDLGPVR